MSKSILPTCQTGDKEIIVKMLEPVIIDNVLYKQSCKYKMLVWIAKELCWAGYCFYIIKPEDLENGM